MSRDDASILDALTFVQEILRITDGITEEQFLADTTTQYAVLYLFTVLGEAVTRLSPEFRAQHPETAWRSIVGMRNVLIHGYEQVNLHRVWATIADALPGFISTVEQIVIPPAE